MKTFLFVIKEMIDVFSKYVEMVETTIDLDRIRNHEYVIKSDYDKDLKGLIKFFCLNLFSNIFIFRMSRKTR